MSLFAENLPPDLKFVPSWLSEVEHRKAIEEVDSRPFENTLSRRVQHYGARYDYFDASVKEIGSAPPIPEFLWSLGQRLVAEGYFAEIPEQVIVNEYLSDQGIAAHIDRPDFGPAVATVSLLESWTMQFYSPTDEMIELLLQSRSLAVMTGRSRSEWSHGIARRKSDNVGGLRTSRHRRVSLTFRTLNHK